MTDLDEITLAGFTSITDLEQWAAEQNVLGETDIDGAIVNTDWLRDWAHSLSRNETIRYADITTRHLDRLYHTITGLSL